MKIIKKIAAKAADNMNEENIIIAFLGDSVTQGCFEIYKKADQSIETVFDLEHGYHSLLNKLFHVLYPSVPISMINAGISGDTAPHALIRLERDVLRHNPDLVVVCLGLNDCDGGLENIAKYTEALAEIFDVIQFHGIEVIFMTPNMMNPTISAHIQDEDIRKIAVDKQKLQNDGILDAYIEEAKKVCNRKGVIICDCYEKWKTLYRNGVDIAELLANKVNHPIRQMNWLFAVSLFETMVRE